MEDTLISFETAKLAKEKGFYQFTNIRKVFDNGSLKRKPSMGTGTWSDFGNRYLPAPTQSLLQKWLREIHNIHIKIDDFIDDKTGIEWDYEIVIIGTDLDEKGNYIPLISYDMNDSIERKFKTYEEALEKGLQEALKSITLIK